MIQLATLVSKDVKEEARRPHEILALFSLSAAFSLPLSYLISGPGTTVLTQVEAANLVVIGQIGLSILISTLLGFLMVIREAEKGTLYALRMAPIAPEVMFLAKTVVIFLFTISLNIAYASIASFLSSQLFITFDYLMYLLALSMYMSSLGALVSFMIIYTDVGTLLASVSIAALSAPYLFSTVSTAVECIVGSPGYGFFLPSFSFTILALLLSKFLIEL
ncbi:hypothetical protein EYM_01645 [Ignicoccus islandicus DSM 13165]|uniref:ABC-2 type transporter domain-containing protein n=1 Tax=Ignicoccus islandicus DSM 13165 TaxID=940295 RepID=A0A0U3F3W0_9CREN|nr:hypothetical protein [Ignicoccus islandicus]ALU12229.1 hypothetical protein EYM_01645 [Ignicoccus islandicus DSM 13165]